MTQRIAPRSDTWPRHDNALQFVNDLILDLKLQVLGQPPNKPIDMTRLQEWTKHRANLEQCQDPMRFH